MSKQLFDLVRDAYRKQDELNSKLNPEWKTQGWNYARAVWTECGEAVEHIKSWQWWKKGGYGKPLEQSDREQLQLELVDILHFGLSMGLVYAFERRYVQDHLEAFAVRFSRLHQVVQGDGEACAAYLEFVARSALGNIFDIEAFTGACTAIGLTIPKLLFIYEAKYTLNRFRWDNGYNLPKDDPKAYRKSWPATTDYKDGDRVLHVEDNVVLFQIVNTMMHPRTDEDLVAILGSGYAQEAIYKALSERYPR